MSEFRKGDVCSLEVTVSELMDDGQVVVTYEDKEKGTAKGWVPPYLLTLLRRDPVDLETCEIGGGFTVRHAEYPEHYGRMISRVTTKDGDVYAFVDWESGEPGVVLVSDLRPADAPAPDQSEVELANAHLIAAAPDLLDVARAGVRMREAQRKYFSDRTRDNLLASKDAERDFDLAARAAIAKAECRP